MSKLPRQVLAVTVLLAAPSMAVAQNFTGEWALIESAGGNAAWSSPLGDQGSIMHANEVITIAPAVARSTGQGERTYRLDGSDARFNVTTADGTVRNLIARVRWISTALVITTTTLPTVPTENAWDAVVTLSLNGAGHLEVLMVGPNLWPFDSASTSRFIYQKAR